MVTSKPFLVVVPLILLSVMLCSCTNGKVDDSCNGDSGADKLYANPDIVNQLPALIKQDEEREAFLFSDNFPAGRIVDRFYQIVSQPLQTACTFSKKIGGEWLANCGFFDGDKFVCMDKIYDQMAKGNGECLVYSFGIADDWTFEDTMAGMGCRVRAFDPTIDAEEKRLTLMTEKERERFGDACLSGVYTSNLFNDLEFYLGQILSLYEAKYLGQIFSQTFCFIEGQYLAQMKYQIV